MLKKKIDIDFSGLSKIGIGIYKNFCAYYIVKESTKVSAAAAAFAPVNQNESELDECPFALAWCGVL